MTMQNGKNVRTSSGKGIMFFSIVLLIGLIIALAAVLPQFYINRIEIEGNRHLSDTELISASGIESGKHLLFYVSGGPSELIHLRYGKVEKRLLEAYPYLESVDVRAKFPYKVVITAKERTEVGYLKTPDDYAVIDSAGLILERIPADSDLDAPVFIGISAAGLKPGEYIEEDSRRAVLRALVAVDAVLRTDRAASDRLSLMQHIKSFYPYSANTLYIEMENLSGSTIHVRINPSDNPESRVSWLRNALAQGAFEDLGENGVIDLSGKQNIFSPSQTVPPLPTFTEQKPSSDVPPASGSEESAASETTGSETAESETEADAEAAEDESPAPDEAQADTDADAEAEAQAEAEAEAEEPQDEDAEEAGLAEAEDGE